MTAVEPVDVKRAAEATSLPIWAGILGVPALWAIDFSLKYVLSEWVCLHGGLSLMHWTTGIFFVLSVIMGLLCWRTWRRTGAALPESTEGGPLPRTRFLAGVSLLTVLLFTLLILAEGLPPFFMDPCPK